MGKHNRLWCAETLLSGQEAKWLSSFNYSPPCCVISYLMCMWSSVWVRVFVCVCLSVSSSTHESVCACMWRSEAIRCLPQLFSTLSTGQKLTNFTRLAGQPASETGPPVPASPALVLSLCYYACSFIGNRDPPWSLMFIQQTLYQLDPLLNLMTCAVLKKFFFKILSGLRITRLQPGYPKEK